MTKKFINIICAAIMLISAVGCSEDDKQISTESSDLSSTVSEVTDTATSQSSVSSDVEETPSSEASATEASTQPIESSEPLPQETTASSATTLATEATTAATTTAKTTASTANSTTAKTTAVTTEKTTVVTTAKTTTSATTVATITTPATTAKVDEPVISEEDDISDLTTMEIVRDMGVGINLGNTYESFGDWLIQWGDGTVESYETAWGSPVITEKMIKGYADAGFGVLRVPVAWSNLMGDNYTVSAEYIDAVKEVVDWALKYDMYVIINLHYDSGWLENFPTDKKNCMKKYKRIWEQVSDAFKDYDEKLMFESQNEELGWFSVWDYYSGTKGKAESYALVNEVNQTFVDIIRSSGGKNDTRHLLISGYNTDIDRTCDSLFEMPDDPADRCAVSVHYYTPYPFTLMEKDEVWAKVRSTWGTAADMQELEYYMDKVKTAFVDKGVPVIIGEYGCMTQNRDPASVRLFLSSVCEEAYTRGMCPVLWSITDGHYDRDTCKIIDPQLAEFYRNIVD